MAPPTSEVWTYFSKKSAMLASCKRCNNTIKFCGNTSNLHKHLKTHNITLSKSKKISKRKAKEMEGLDYDDNSDVLIEENENEDNESVNEAPNIRSAFQNVSQHKEGGTKYDKITTTILFFICKDMRPFHIVEGEGFLTLLKLLAPMYKVPSSEYFKKKLCEKHETVMNLYKRRLQKACALSITLDIWTETMSEISYMGVTAHFLEGIDQINCAIATRKLTERHTALYISDSLKNILNEWDIELPKIRCIITDNAANMVAAIKMLVPEKNHLPCFPHTINLVVQAGLRDPTIETIVKKVRNIVKWVKNSVINSDKMRRIQMEHGIPEGSVKKYVLDVATRWNSAYYMIERFLELLKVTSELVVDNVLSPEMPNPHEIEILKQLLILLQPFEFLTRETSGENYVSISKIIPMVNCLLSALTKFHTTYPAVENISQILSSEMKRRFCKIEFNSHLAISSLLAPRFKNVNFSDALACGHAITKLKNIISENSFNSSSDSEDLSPVKSPNFDFWQHHKELVVGKSRRKAVKTDEVTLYLSSPISSLRCNPLEEWEDLKVTFPQLYKQARLFLSVVGSSVPCERLFSKAGATITKSRNRLSGKYLEKLLFLGNIPQKIFFILIFILFSFFTFLI